MPTVNELKKSALNDAGYSGSISDAEYKWLKAICDPYVGSIPDMWRYALLQAGYPNSITVGQNEMLVDLGHTGAIPNKWYKYWRDTPLQGMGGATIVLSVTSIAENAASGSVVGALSVISGSGSYTFSITADPDSKFAIDGSNLETDAALDYETAISHSVTIEADNGVDTPITRTFTITVTNVTESAIAPDAYTVGQWSLADNEAGNSLTITITALPSLNGNTQTGTQYRINSGAWQTTALVGLGDIMIVDGTDLPNDLAADIEIRVLVAEYDWDVDGTGDEDSVSDTKSATPTLVTAAAPDAFTEPGWSLVPADGELGVDFADLPADNDSPITDIKWRVDGGAWTSSGGIVPFVIPGLTNGVEYDVELQTINAIGASGPSDLKSAEPIAGVTGLTYEFAGWINNDGVGGTTATASLDLGSAAADRFVLLGVMANGYPTVVSVPLSLPGIVDEESWGRRAFYGDFVTTGSGSTSMTIENGSGADIWAPVFVIRGSTTLVVKDFEVGNPATVTVEAGDLVIAMELFNSSEPWTNSPTEAAESTYAGSSTGFYNGYAAVFRATADNAAFSPGVTSGRSDRIALIVLGEPA